MNTLEQGMRYLTDERRVVTGITVAYGDAGRAECTFYGNGSEVALENGVLVPNVMPLAPNTVFDLASVTKLFTCISVMQLMERGALRLSDPIPRFAPQFSALSGVTVQDLLGFQKPLLTDGRVDAAASREEALARLFSAHAGPEPERRYYTDIGAMTLKYVIEAAAAMPYADYLKACVFAPLGMAETFPRVPEAALFRTCCYNYERRVTDGRHTLDTACPRGQTHDPKARILRDGGADLPGHAGLFSTAGDMVRLAQGLLSDRLLKRETLLEIGKRRVGRRLPDGRYTQYLGYLCFVKHPVQTYSEAPACFSEGTIALNGFTGNHFSVDPAQNRFMLVLSNRIHNRITVLTGRPDPAATGVETAPWPDGHDYIVSQNYVYMKDKNIKNPVGERFLADF